MKPIYSPKISSKIGTSEHLADQDITYKYTRFKTLGKYDVWDWESYIHCLHCYCTAFCCCLAKQSTSWKKWKGLRTVKVSKSREQPSPCPSGLPGCWRCTPRGPLAASAPGEAPPGAGDHWSGDCGDQSQGDLNTSDQIYRENFWNANCVCSSVPKLSRASKLRVSP